MWGVSEMFWYKSRDQHLAGGKKNITKHRHKYIQIHHISPYHRPSKISITTSQALITPSHSQALPLLDELQGLAAKRVEATTQEARQVLHVRPGPRWLPGKAVWILTDIGRYWIPWILLDLRNLGSWKHNPHMRSYMRSLSYLGA